MKEEVNELKKVISKLTEMASRDMAIEALDAYEQKIRAIEVLLHAMTLIEKMDV